MSGNFEFDAPQFVNFADADDPKADRFFDITPAGESEKKNQNLNFPMSLKGVTANQLDSENQGPSSTVTSKNFLENRKPTSGRKILHEIANHQNEVENNIKSQEMIQNFEKLQVSDTRGKKSRLPIKATEVFSGVKQQSEKKLHPMMTRLDAISSRSSMKSSFSSTHSEDYDNHVSSTTLGHMKPIGKKRTASPLNSTRKFISLAEQVEHFYKDTPDRYRSKPTKQTSKYQKTPVRKGCPTKPNCIPKTPNLTTKYRLRKVDYPDEKQREEMELEEIKKHQIKANPLNEKILKGPCLNLKAPIIKKPVTVPQPFSLTEVKKKEQPPEPVFQFKAQPVPITILNGRIGIPPKKVAPPTIPSTPQIKVPVRLRVEVKSQEKNSSCDSSNLPRNTKVEPFSFDARMRDLLQKKEEFVKKVIEEEKKSFNSFKAHPMPLFKSKNESTPKVDKILHKTVPQPFNLTQPKGNKSLFLDDQANNRATPFKARPADVVHMKPFVPKLQKYEVPLPVDFKLNTEKRAQERHKFDEKLKQKEEELALILKRQKEEEEKLEKEKIQEERKKAEFKANPVPRYKPFEIHGADPEKLTLPQTPMFSFKRKQAKGEN